jgi:hypothetical protein
LEIARLVAENAIDKENEKSRVSDVYPEGTGNLVAKHGQKKSICRDIRTGCVRSCSIGASIESVNYIER